MQLALVDAKRALGELRHCRRLPSAREYDAETRRRAEYGSDLAQFELSALLHTGTRYADGGTLAADPVAAYMWIVIARRQGRGNLGWALERQRKSLAATLDPAQVAEAEERAPAWLEAADPSQH